jgi:hypothetical protein
VRSKELNEICRALICFVSKKACTVAHFQFLYFPAGSDEYILYSLMTFGIPSGAFPITDNGDLRIERHQEWVDARRIIESKRNEESVSSSRVCILVPSRVDVVLGRGKPFQDHPGNLRLRFLVESLLPQYDEVPKFEKVTVAQQVIATLKKGGSRFLKQVDGVWVEMDDVTARKKICHNFRTLRAKVLNKRGQKIKNDRELYNEHVLDQKRSRESNESR